LLEVNGVGPKAAMAVISKLSPEEFYRAVYEERESLLTGVPGIGSKTARRIIFYLKEKIAKNFSVSTSSTQSEKGELGEACMEDAEEALVSLGYSRNESRHVLRQVLADVNTAGEEYGAEKLVKAALWRLGREQS